MVSFGNILRSELAAPEAVLDMLSSWEGKCLSVGALCKGGTLLGISEQSIRVALTRLTRQGKVEKLERGQYRLIPEGNKLLSDVHGWYENSQRVLPWNKGWIGVCDTAVARSQRTIWRQHQKAMKLRGFRALDSGLYLRPDNLRGGLSHLRTELYRLGLARQATVFGIDDLSPEDEDEALALWDVDVLERRYRELMKTLTDSEASLPAMRNEDAAAETLLVGRNIIRTVIEDPLLPREMLQTDQRDILVERTKAYQARARKFWHKIPEFAALDRNSGDV